MSAEQLPPDLAEAYRTAASLLDNGTVDQAATILETIVSMAPRHFPSLNRLAYCHFARRNYSAAEQAYRQAVSVSPQDVGSLFGLATSIHEGRASAEAVEIYKSVLAVDPNHVGALHNLANWLRDAGQVDEAIACYQKALALKPDHHVCGLNYSQALFYREDWGEAWRMFEARLATANLIPPITIRDRNGASVAQPHWRGGPQPRSLLVVAEQGLGDAIQFARFLPELVRTGTRVTVLLDRKLIALLRTLPAPIEFVPRDSGQTITTFNAWTPLLSLPLALDLRPGGLAPKIPYLAADPARAARWRERLGPRGFKIGIAWQGNPEGSIDNGRSMPLAHFAPLADIPGVRLISLQKGFGEEQVTQVSFRDRIETLGPEFDASPDALVDTAAAMTALDLVITTDTAIPHLAGALGRPFWIVLKTAPNWRWLFKGDGNPFYPTARLFRQQRPGDWMEVMTRVAEALRRHVA